MGELNLSSIVKDGFEKVRFRETEGIDTFFTLTQILNFQFFSLYGII